MESSCSFSFIFCYVIAAAGLVTLAEPQDAVCQILVLVSSQSYSHVVVTIVIVVLL